MTASSLVPGLVRSTLYSVYLYTFFMLNSDNYYFMFEKNSFPVRSTKPSDDLCVCVISNHGL